MFSILLAVIYAAFVSLGLPDGLLGSGWPTMQPEFAVPVSFAGIVSMIISLGTIVSSLNSDRLTRKFGTGKVTAVSVLLTAVALFGFATAPRFWVLCLWAIPYGLGAGSVDASLNNFVALHYESRHMSWLHCMWGVGASVGPYVMGAVLAGGLGWRSGYSIIGIVQMVLVAFLLISLPLWKKATAPTQTVVEEKHEKSLSLPEILRIPGVKAMMASFALYSLVEQTPILWISSFMQEHHGLDESLAAAFSGMFCLGITVGRAISGFVSMKFNDKQMVFLGEGIVAVGVAVLLIPTSYVIDVVGFALVGLGCAPIFPCLIHATPLLFGADKSQAVIGVQMASAYSGTLLWPPIFGLLAQNVSVSLLPLWMTGGLAFLVIASVRLFHKKLSTVSN